jgi:hypothetical protein
MTSQLESLQTVLTRRFMFNAFLPALIFGTLVTVGISAMTGRWPDVEATWTSLDALSKIVASFAYLAGVWFIAVAIAGQWRSIIRLYEGYPLWSLNQRWRIPVPGIRWHQERLLELRNVRADPGTAYYYYPRERWSQRVLPSRLGNILLAAETYPVERYGIDPIIFWPRLYPQLPEDFRQDYVEFVREYEFPLVVSFLSAVSACILGSAAVITRRSAGAFVVAFAGLAVLAWVAYLVSLGSAVQMAEQQRTAFDMYRGRILDAWPTVRDVADEREAFNRIGDFIVRSAPARWGEAQDRRSDRRSTALAGSRPNRPDEGPLQN